MSFTIDCRGKEIRAINRELRAAIVAGQREFMCCEPDARHNLGVALLEPVHVVFEGSVGYYCARHDGRCHHRGSRQRRLGRGRVDAGRHDGHRRQRRQRRGGGDPRRDRGSARRRGRSGRRVDEGRHAADRRQLRLYGRLHDAEGPYHHLRRCRRRPGRLDVRGRCLRRRRDPLARQRRGHRGARAGGGDSFYRAAESCKVPGPAAFKKVVSGRKLWNFDTKELGTWKVAL